MKVARRTQKAAAAVVTPSPRLPDTAMTTEGAGEQVYVGGHVTKQNSQRWYGRAALPIGGFVT